MFILVKDCEKDNDFILNESQIKYIIPNTCRNSEIKSIFYTNIEKRPVIYSNKTIDYWYQRLGHLIIS